MAGEATVQLTQTAYQAHAHAHRRTWKTAWRLSKADDGSRIPHPVALAIIRGESPLVAFRTHHGLTLRELARRAEISPSYLSEIEHARKPGSAATLAKIATTLNTTIDTLLTDSDPR